MSMTPGSNEIVDKISYLLDMFGGGMSHGNFLEGISKNLQKKTAYENMFCPKVMSNKARHKLELWQSDRSWAL